MKYFFCFCIIVFLFLLTFAVRCHFAVKKSKAHLTAYAPKTARLSYGDMTYADEGEGDVILSVHGIFGGFDQAFDTCRDFASDHRILAPSRFGYLGSDMDGDGTPARQAKAYAELLDRLGIDRVFVLATSAGGSVALRFALDFPERTRGLILYCSAMPFAEKPEKYASYAGPPACLCSDFAMFLLSPLFQPILGMSPSAIGSMLPVKARKKGIVLDAAVTNPDMARNFEDYPVETLAVPTLILHAKDDKLADFASVLKALPRFPKDTSFVAFETGGHLMKGNEKQVQEKVSAFLRRA